MVTSDSSDENKSVSCDDENRWSSGDVLSESSTRDEESESDDYSSDSDESTTVTGDELNKKAKMALLRSLERKNCPPPSSYVIQLTGTIFELNSRIKETNVLSKFHENWAKNVTSTVFTCFHYIHTVKPEFSGGQKNAPPTGGHVFSPIPTIFKLGKLPLNTIDKNAPPPTDGHVFSPISTIFELCLQFTRKTAPRTGGHVFQHIRTTF
ncbi:hypothetical protein DPMN_087036 [Dreissena polymorpha]|uniref:Uncharacterized protein n=1 Tax=Dreissena polymorpha TaxID=45954 RepID=A0A9D4KSH8_DREPO|nr:hypothetical protein DPMN_087036 [Dreissena polymorpha]